jgi:hypothetical protein
MNIPPGLTPNIVTEADAVNKKDGRVWNIGGFFRLDPAEGG